MTPAVPSPAQTGLDTVAIALPTDVISEARLETALYDPAVEIGLATLLLVVVIGIHGICLGQISKLFATRIARLKPTSPRWRASTLTAVSIGLIVALHFGETHLWALALIEAGLISGYRDAYFYVLEAYTTLGEGAAYMADGYRLISPLIALTGLFTFGWSTSVLVYIVGQVGRLHEERERQSTPST